MPRSETIVASHGHVILREEHEGRVARIVLANPPENALDVDLLTELLKTVDALERWPELACVVIEGAGREFSSGLSLPQRRQPYVRSVVPAFHHLARKLVGLDAIVVSFVRGRCLGAGFELALLSHAILCDATARIGLPELTFGAIPPLGTLLLPRRLPPAKAEELILSGRVLPADEALAAGLVNACAGGWDDLESLGARWIRENVLSRSNVPLRAFAAASRRELRAILADDLAALEELYLNRVAGSQDAAEGIDAALHRRAATWSHR